MPCLCSNRSDLGILSVVNWTGFVQSVRWLVRRCRRIWLGEPLVIKQVAEGRVCTEISGLYLIDSRKGPVETAQELITAGGR